MTIEDRIKDNVVVWLLGTLFAGFTAGVGAYKTINDIAGNQIVTKTEYEAMQRLKSESSRLTGKLEQLQASQAIAPSLVDGTVASGAESVACLALNSIGQQFRENNSYNVNLPNDQVISGCKVNEANAAFSVDAPGLYTISYEVNFASEAYAITSINVNDNELQQSVNDEVSKRFQGTAMVHLKPSDMVRLRLNVGKTPVTLRQRAGAKLLISSVQTR